MGRRPRAAAPAILLAHLLAALATPAAAAGEGPPGRDLFGTRGGAKKPGPEDSEKAPVPATVVWSDGTQEAGKLSFTAGVPLTVYDLEGKEFVEIDLADLARLTATPRAENLDREWRWKENGSDEKVYTGRVRPRRWLDHEVVLADGARMKVHIKGTVMYLDVAPPAPEKRQDGSKAAKEEPRGEAPPVRRRLDIRQYDRGKWGDTLESLAYVKSITIGTPAPPAAGEGVPDGKARAPAKRSRGAEQKP